MPQLKTEVSKEELKDFEGMMDDVGITSRYEMVKVLVTGALKEWRKKKNERENGKKDSGTEGRRQKTLAISY